MEVLKSIVNWELWQKIQKPKKIETEIKFNRQNSFEGNGTVNKKLDKIIHF